MKEEKLGTAAEVIFHNETNFYTILLFETTEEQFFAVGSMPQPKKGRRYKLIGEWTQHPKYGEQFAFSSYEEPEPTTEDGILSFLSSGVIKGVGPSTALAIVKHFGEETMKIIADAPERLTEVTGIGKVKAAAIAESYGQHQGYAQTVMKLAPYDISPAVCMKLFRTYGADAVNTVLENPYQLIDDVYGIGFQKADKIAQKVGIEPDSPFRIRSAVVYALYARAGIGDTYAPEDELAEDVAQLLDVPRNSVREAMLDLALDGKVYKEVLGGERIVILAAYRRAERTCAYRINLLTGCELSPLPDDPYRLIARTEKAEGISLTETQKRAVISSLGCGVSIITGGPGTGKTTIIKTMIALLKEAGISFRLAAPTGRAAKRMAQASGEDAQTIHRLLEYTFADGDERMYFGRNAENPLDASCIIIDEVSMVDILLMEGLLNAIKPGTRLVLVGDADQLPPVGAGSVLSDLLESGMVHSTRLTDIFRQAQESMIVVNAHAVNRGEYPSFNTKDTDCFFLERSGDREIAQTIKQLCQERLPKFYGELDPYRDIQVLTPTRKGICGSVELNKLLQEALNPPLPSKSEKAFGERIFREGDKVMQNKNNYQLEWKDIRTMESGMGIFNGDMGIVMLVDNDAVTVSVLFDECRMVTYDYMSLEELEPAFALTVHKSQGSEFPVVVMPMTHFPPMLATRNLLYTAMTRARQGVVMVGRPNMPAAMTDNTQGRKRKSGLGERIKELMDWGTDEQDL